MAIRRIDHVGIAVPDLDEALVFYRDMFGLVAEHEEGARGHLPGCERVRGQRRLIAIYICRLVERDAVEDGAAHAGRDDVDPARRPR